MQIGCIENPTRIIGKSQGYLGLPIKDEFVNCKVNGERTPVMISAWLPTPKELEALNAGASIHVKIIGIRHPPIIVEVNNA